MISKEIQELLDKRAIYEVVNLMARAADRLDAELMTACMHPDVRFIAPAGASKGTWVMSAAEIVNTAMNFLQALDGTLHVLGTHNVELNGDRALSETYVTSHHWGTPRTDRKKNFRTGTRYVDLFERREGQWKIAERNTIRLFSRYEVNGDTDLEVPTEENGWPVSFRNRDDIVYNRLSQ